MDSLSEHLWQMLTYEMQRRLEWPNRLVTSSSLVTMEYLKWVGMKNLGENILESSLLDLWNKLSELERLYLRVRACDIACFGTAIADKTWPQPTIAGAMAERVSDLVSLLVELETDVIKEKNFPVKRDNYGQPLGRCYFPDPSALFPMPEALPPLALNEKEREAVNKACLDELLQSGEGKWNALGMLEVIKEIVQFCNLLSKPENHIKKPTGQYIEKEVPLRTVADMVNEMRGKLTDLPNFTAYAKIMQVKPTFQPMLKRGSIPYFLPEKNTSALKEGTEYPVKDGTQTVAKHKINTPMWYELPEKWPSDVSAHIQQEILNQTYKEYCQSREIIEEQIREKQKAWQIDSSEKPMNAYRR